MVEDEVQVAADMDLEGAELLETSEAGDASPKPAENGSGKRARGEGESEPEEEESGAVKKQKAERSVEEERLEGKVAEGEGEKQKDAGPVTLGPKEFGSSVEMFDYFYKLLHTWAPNLDINKYEFLVLQDLLKKGHPDHIKKIGAGLSAFQVRYHPLWKSRCFFIARTDGSSEDFSFRKCVDHIIPLPDDMKAPDRNKAGRGGGGGGRGGGGRGGRGGRGRRGRF